MPFIILVLMLTLSLLAGWVNNIIWLFNQTELVPALLGIIGVIFAPIGALHGVYLFF